MSKTILAKVDGWTPLIDCLVKDVGLPAAAVFGRVWRYCQMQNGVCEAAIERMGDELGIDRKTFMRHLSVLTKKGYLLDHTPGVRNKPHVYSDTGKAGLSVTISGVPKMDTATDGVPKSPSRCTNLVHEDSIKIQKEEDKEFSKIFKEYEKMHAFISPSDAHFLGMLLDEWREFSDNLPSGHPDKLIPPADVIIKAFTETALHADNPRSLKYTDAILRSWMKNGVGKKKGEQNEKGIDKLDIELAKRGLRPVSEIMEEK